MTDKGFYNHVEGTLKKSLVILVMAFIVLFLERQNLLLWGFVVGLLIGIVNTFFLALRIDKMTSIVLQSQDRRKANSFFYMGFMTRWGLIITACWFAIQTGLFSLLGMIFGFLVPLVFSTGEGIRSLRPVSDKRM